ATADIQRAADLLRPIYDAAEGGDGFVSVEVSPQKAFQTQETLEEARRWWRRIDRPNLMVKIPATQEGIPAIEACLAEGLNINIPLIFALELYESVMEASLRGLERRAAAGQEIRRVASVASFFVSRVDTAADKRIEARLPTAPGAARERLAGLLGKVAVAN